MWYIVLLFSVYRKGTNLTGSRCPFRIGSSFSSDSNHQHIGCLYILCGQESCTWIDERSGGLFGGHRLLAGNRGGALCSYSPLFPEAKGCGKTRSTDLTVMGYNWVLVCLNCQGAIACENGLILCSLWSCSQAPFEITRAFLSLASAQRKLLRTCCGRTKSVMCRSEWADVGVVLLNCPGYLWPWQVTGGVHIWNLPNFSASSSSMKPGQTGSGWDLHFHGQWQCPPEGTVGEVRV
jgi:hypothetical protein